jgi:hypothetical protein
MKIIGYAGIDEAAIVIQRKQDLYPLLDWFQTQLMDLGAEDSAIQYLSSLMEKVEADGYGSYDDIDAIEWI